MLVEFMSFRGRLRRLEFFLRSLALFVVEVLVMGGVLGATFAMRQSGFGVLIFAGLVVLVAAPVFIWSGLALQARRLRDMGWEPLYVLPAWFVAMTIDIFLASGGPAPPAMALHSSPVGALINLAMTGCLLFWPSKMSDEGGSRVASAEPTYKPWVASIPAPAPGPSGFGRRGV